MEDDGWKEYQVYILEELKRLSECYNKLDARLIKVGNAIAGLKVKAGVWGLIAGAIPVLIGIILFLLKGP